MSLAESSFVRRLSCRNTSALGAPHADYESTREAARDALGDDSFYPDAPEAFQRVIQECRSHAPTICPVKRALIESFSGASSESAL